MIGKFDIDNPLMLYDFWIIRVLAIRAFLAIYIDDSLSGDDIV